MLSAQKPRIIYNAGGVMGEKISVAPRIPISVEVRNGTMGVRRIEIVPAPSPSGNSYQSADSDSDESGSSGGAEHMLVGGEGTRKRHRLTNLTPEEKMMRRKLKNRVAAQTARDRKKLKMSELEEALSAMEAENRRLLAENERLKKSSGSLSVENQALKQRLVLPPTAPINVNATRIIVTPHRRIVPSVQSESSKFSSVAGSKSPLVPTPAEAETISEAESKAESKAEPVAVFTGRSCESKRESAALTSGPQQKELFARTVVALMTVHCLTALALTLSVTRCLNFWTGSTPTSASSTPPAPSSSSMTSPLAALPSNAPLLPPWWGAHQRNWNPTMNS